MLSKNAFCCFAQVINLRQCFVQSRTMTAVIDHGVVSENVLLNGNARRALAIFEIGDGLNDHFLVSRMLGLCFRRHIVRYLTSCGIVNTLRREIERTNFFALFFSLPRVTVTCYPLRDLRELRGGRLSATNVGEVMLIHWSMEFVVS